MNRILRNRIISGAATAVFVIALLIGGGVATRMNSYGAKARLRAISYTSVSNNSDRAIGTVSEQQLEDDIECFAENGIRFVTPGKLDELNYEGVTGQDCVMLIFERADASFFNNAVPILRRFGACAVLLVQNDELLTYADDISNLYGEGIIETALCVTLASEASVETAALLSDARLELLRSCGINDTCLAYRAVATRSHLGNALMNISAVYKAGAAIVYGDGKIEKDDNNRLFIIKRLPRNPAESAIMILHKLFPAE